ncbi:hypothetical protein H6P87_01158 [Rickettsia tillamookensis]|uniref:Uncharacterized protein n=1 Tax=Rickettsia tillamookensis TaxID=2761623 RepID=A0A9E6SQY1_9RICK|nr:hypothetical protein [Rickettsia tillamookensis]QQV75596.1 hypothetical protein H6P87_01158 [Rickettsia tillamookensis]
MFDQLNILYPLLISIFIFLVVVVISKITGYKKTLKEKNLSIIQFYLDKKFLHNHLNKNLKSPRTENYANSFLENIKSYFKLDDIRVISQKELESNQELSSLFKDKLEEVAASFLDETKKDITALYEVLHANKESQDQEEHRLYIYLPPDQIKKKDAKKLIYVKSPYKFTKEEIETLDIYIHLVQLFNTSSE